MGNKFLSYRPLQSRTAIAEALKLVGIDALWDTIEPNRNNKDTMLKELDSLVRRRNQISHEGDRTTSRRSGKVLRPISRPDAERWITFVEDLIGKIETAFPG